MLQILKSPFSPFILQYFLLNFKICFNFMAFHSYGVTMINILFQYFWFLVLLEKNFPMPRFFFLYKFIYLIYLFLAEMGLHFCMRGFSSCGERGLLFVAVRGLLTAVASLVAEHGLQACGLQQLWHMGSVVVARGLQSTGSVVVAHGLCCSAACGIFRTRAQTRVPCIGRRILNH